MKEKILKDGDEIVFVPRTDKYGVAEFAICPVVKRGKLIEIYVYPEQQENMEFYYRIPVNRKTENWQVISWAHKGMHDPRIWIFFWCKEHKCQGFRVYVPPESHKFSVSLLSTVQIAFDI